VASSALQDAVAVVVPDLAAAARVVNYLAPEHLQLMVEDPWRLLPYIKHAGSIFLGPYSPAALADYAAGPNHVLPTGRTARFSSPLGVRDFLVASNVMYCTREAFRELSPTARELAQAEGLLAHGAALQAREEESR